MGFTKRHLESLPEVKQNEILGMLSEDDEWEYHGIDPDCEAWQSQREAIDPDGIDPHYEEWLATR